MRLFAHIFLCLAAFAAPVGASAGAGGAMDYGSVRLLEGWRGADGTHTIAVAVMLNRGWKTYWRSPGESGIPPEFDWTGSRNVASAEVLWPRPEVFEIFGFRTIGYRRPVVIPIEITPRDATMPSEISLRFNFGACADICIPTQADFSASLSLGPVDMGSSQVRAIQTALGRVPVIATGRHVRSVNCKLKPKKGGMRLSADVELAGTPPPSIVTIVETGDPDLWVGGTETTVSGHRLKAAANIENYGNDSLVVDRSALRLTVLGDDLALDIRGCPAS
ncbi:MAG: protein-disulfide reductase DsbD domain-containing protein [Paracoccaceae bacterium]